MFTKKKPLEIKKQTVSVSSTSKPALSRPRGAPSSTSSSPSSHPRSPASHSLFSPARRNGGASTAARSRFSSDRPRDQRSSAATSRPVKRKRPAADAAPDFGSDDDEEESGEDSAVEEEKRRIKEKRSKQREVRALYKDRRVRSKAAFEVPDGSEGQGVSVPIVHAAEIPRLDVGAKYEPYFADGEGEGGFELRVQYPSLCERER